MQTGIIEMDIHGMNKLQAKAYIDSQLRRKNNGVYRIRIIHGYHNGTELRDMVKREYKNSPGVLRIEMGLNQGITDLILREFY